MSASGSGLKHRARRKEARLREVPRKVCRLVEIDSPVTWIRDIERSKIRTEKSSKSILKRPGQQLDITLTLDALENEIVNKSQVSPRSASTGKKVGRLSFNNVSVFYFNRSLGQSTVPRWGTHPLGMDMKHVDHEKMKVSQYSSGQTGRVTRLKSRMAKHQETHHKQERKLVTFTALKQSPPSGISSVSSSSSSSSSSSPSSSSAIPSSVLESGGSWSEPYKLSERERVREGLFQELCSSPGPSRMLSSSSVSSLTFPLLPSGYTGGKSEFPWRPVREDGRGLASAFSAQLSVEDTRRTLPQPPTPLLSHFSSSCSRSFRDYHQALQSVPDQGREPHTGQVVTSALTRLRRRKRKVEEEGEGVRRLSAKDRRVLLRSQGVAHSGRAEGEEITEIQTSRETNTGCSCRDGCQPGTCECSRNNISCHTEYAGFPCACLTTCNNSAGRKVFDNVAVALHFINTMVAVEGVMDISRDPDHGPPVKKKSRK